jgi:hypothetical protein
MVDRSATRVCHSPVRAHCRHCAERLRQAASRASQLTCHMCSATVPQAWWCGELRSMVLMHSWWSASIHTVHILPFWGGSDRAEEAQTWGLLCGVHVCWAVGEGCCVSFPGQWVQRWRCVSHLRRDSGGCVPVWALLFAGGGCYTRHPQLSFCLCWSHGDPCDQHVGAGAGSEGSLVLLAILLYEVYLLYLLYHCIQLG